MDLLLDGQLVLITGSSRGIGKGIAEAFLQEGAKVILTGREKMQLDETEALFSAQYGSERVVSWQGDLGRKQICSGLYDLIHKKYGFLDHLVCSIGSGRSVPPMEEDIDEFQRMLDINLLNAVTAVQKMSPLLGKISGKNGKTPSILFIGSICGVEALGCPVAYASAKSALEAYAMNIAGPLGRKGIRVNMISPGNIIFPGSTWEDKLCHDRAYVEAMLDREVPLGRLGTLEEVADVAVFLASKRAGFVNGANWVVDGGQTR